MLPDLNRLGVFRHVYAGSSVAAAARTLHVTQSAVSQHLKKLEAEVGTPLFSRVGKRLVPTRAGQRLYDVISPFVDELSTTLEHIEREREDPYGLLRIGAPVVFGTGILPEILAAFRREHSGVRFHLELGHPETLLQRLEQGQLDFAFADIFLKKGEFLREYAHLSIEPVMIEELVLVASKKYHRNHLGGDGSFQKLAKAEFVSYQQDASAVRAWFRHHFGKTRVPLTIVFSVESVQGVKAGVLCDMGLGVVPRHVVATEINQGRIVQIGTTRKEIVNRVSLVQLQDKVPGPAEKTFVSFVKERL